MTMHIILFWKAKEQHARLLGPMRLVVGLGRKKKDVYIN